MAQTAPSLHASASGAYSGAGTVQTSLTIPSSTAAGDLLLIHAGTYIASSIPLAAPTGWTAVYLNNLTSGNATLAVFSKRAVADDAGSTVIVPGAEVAQVDAWSNVGADPVVVSTRSSTSVGSGTSATLATNTLTTADANCTIIETWVGANSMGTADPLPSATVTDTAVQAITGYGQPTGTEYSIGVVCGYQTQASAGTSTSESSTFTWANTGSIVMSSVAIAIPPIQAPAAPTLDTPANAAYQDLSGTPTFTWTYNPTQSDGAQAAISFRRKISGAPSYSYWNPGTSSWQSTPLWFSYTTGSLTFPSGAWVNGNIYNWSVATQEATESLQGAFATDYTVTAQAVATVAVTAPTGSIASTTPTVTATATLPGGASMTGYRVIIYTAAQVAAGGFTPGAGPDVYDSGTVATTSTSISQPIPAGLLSNNATYYAYVAAEETGSEWSAWASSAFTVSVDAPATPTITATAALTGLPSVAVTVTGHDNLLSTDDASFEGSVGTAVAGANTTVAQSTTWGIDGSTSLKLTATAGGNVSATEGPYNVTAGSTYTFTGAYHADSSGRTCRTDVAWYNGATYLSTTTGTTVTDSTSGAAAAFPTATAPAGATKAYLVHNVLSCGASEAHYVDEAGLFPGTVTSWTRGGLVGTTSAIVQRSDDGGITWATIRESSPEPALGAGQQITVTDIEPINVVQYRAAVDAGSGLVSPWSAATAAAVTPTAWVLSDPLDPTTWLTLTRVAGLASTGTSLQIPASFNTTSPQAQGVFQGFGRATAIVQLGDIYDGTVTFSHLIEGYSDKATFDSLRDRNRVLQLRSDMGDSWYVTLPASIVPTVLRATDRTTNPLYLLSGACTIVDAP